MVDPKIQEMLNLADLDLKLLRAAESCKAAREAWIAFLEHSNRAINRLEAHCRRTKRTADYDRLIKELWANDLTRYMRAARNAHEHGVSDIDVDEPYNDRLVFTGGRILEGPVLIGITEEGEEIVMPASAPMEVSGLHPGVRKVSLKPSVRMLPVTHHKWGIIRPAQVPALVAEDEPEVVAAARSYLAWIVEKIGAFS